MILKKKKVMLLLCLNLLYVLWLAPVEAEEEKMDLYARSAVLMDGDSGRILYGKEADTQLPMASTTKIMTCIIALEQGNPEMICTVSPNAAAQPKVKLGMIQGDTFYLKDLLYSLMLESHNDTAVCIAENVSGSVQKFAEKMNEKAQEIGCKHTYYITPNGLDAEDEGGSHHTTAKELALVMRYCLTQSEETEEFLKITQTAEYSFSNTEGSRDYHCRNHNALLTILDGALSGKTGFTNKAGYCYVGAAEKDGNLFIVSLLACGWPNNKGYKWSDTKRLVRYGTENFEKRKLTDQNIKTEEIPVISGVKDYVPTEIVWGKEQDDAGILLRPGEQIKKRIQMQKVLEAPVQQGMEVGRIDFLVNQEVYASYSVVTEQNVDRTDFWFCLRKVTEEYCM